ncbi:MAG: alpha-galactosidase [Anaerolineae bacterium CG03_land_8_20_14_0_80_58_20]|nr:MAG: alpha-galactosidase [Anaerolineae bacterium CG03_land_8_20_14_0_80_58_20]
MEIQITDATPAQQIFSASSLTLGLPRPPRAFYRHGWQSWSLAAWTDLTPLPVQRPTSLHPMQTDPVYVNESLPNGSWLGAVEFENGEILLLGALGMDSHVQLDGRQFKGWYESSEGEWFVARGGEAAAFAKYSEELGKRFGRKSDKPAPRIWCSWYSLYTAIDEPILRNIFDGLGDLPFDVLQVDDGWQVKVGDWEANGKFSSGMAALADKIKSTGRTAGLWLAPLIAVKSSRLFREHPEWFLKDEKGKFVSAGFNWGEQVYALDVTHPAAQEWLAALMKRVRAWGFNYLKLDFLYAGALPGRRHTNMPREAAARVGMKTLRESMGLDAFFLACGMPFLPALGLCDAMRIGPDVAGEWESRRDAILLHNLSTPGVKNAIRTTVNRLWMDPLLHTDPDVAYFTSRANTLTPDQRRLLQDLARVCRFKATSDLPQWLTADKRSQLRAFLEDSSDIKQIERYRFQIGSREVDFSSAMDLPAPPRGLVAAQARVIGWLGNQGWALQILDQMGKHSLEKIKKEI